MDGTFRLLSVAQNQFFRQAFIDSGKVPPGVAFREQKVFRTFLPPYPRLLHLVPRLLGLIPLTTSWWGPLAAGTTNPPGHMQKLYTPRPSTCCTKLYSAAGRYFLVRFYCDIVSGQSAWTGVPSHTDGNSFGFQLHPMGIQPAIYISGRMSGS